MYVVVGFFEWIIRGLISFFSIVGLIVLMVAIFLVPYANFAIWKSELKANLKLIYISVFALLMLGIMMILELRRGEVVDDLRRKFDPDITFYDRNVIKPAKISVDYAAPEEMGLDTCIDPEGNLVDLKKRFKLDNSWVLLEIPNEFLRKESVNAILQRGGYCSEGASGSAVEVRQERHNMIKLEDFKFLDLYLRKQKMNLASSIQDGVLFFDLDGINEDSFDKYIRTVEDYQKGSMRSTNVLFTTSDNSLTNRLSSKCRFDHQPPVDTRISE